MLVHQHTHLAATCLPSSTIPVLQVSRIGVFLSGTLFNHYRLYQYCFNNEQDLTEYQASLMVRGATAWLDARVSKLS